MQEFKVNWEGKGADRARWGILAGNRENIGGK